MVQSQLLVLTSSLLERLGDWEQQWAIASSLLDIILDVRQPLQLQHGHVITTSTPLQHAVTSLC
jgi:hypothetical protein